MKPLHPVKLLPQKKQRGALLHLQTHTTDYNSNERMIYLLTVTLFIQLASAGLFSLPSPQPQPSPEDQYTIDDILSRYRNLSSQTREISFFETQSDLSSSCVRSALSPILSQCLKKSINDLDVRERASTAAKLSICEFQASEIEYPSECQTRAGFFFGADSVDYTSCVRAMETRSQWWTTYSGYYQSIGEICLQESLPYEKEEIWEMFVGVTQNYEKVFDVLQDYVEMSERFKEQSEVSFDVLQKFMEEIKGTSEKNKDQVEVMWTYITKQMEKLSKISVDVTEVAKIQSDTLESNIMIFFQSVDEQFSQELETLKDKFIMNLEERDRVIELSLLQTRSQLASLQLMTQDSYNVSEMLNANLMSSSQAAHHLNHSLIQMNSTVDTLNTEVQQATELMTSFSGILENNVLFRAMLYVSKDFLGVETLLITMTMSTVCFVGFVVISWRVNVFKYVGIFVVSVVVGSALGTVFMLVGRVVNDELERQFVVNINSTDLADVI